MIMANVQNENDTKNTAVLSLTWVISNIALMIPKNGPVAQAECLNNHKEAVEFHGILHQKKPKQCHTTGSQASLWSSRGSFSSITIIYTEVSHEWHDNDNDL